jgi:hypothetical protein
MEVSLAIDFTDSYDPNFKLTCHILRSLEIIGNIHQIFDLGIIRSSLQPEIQRLYFTYKKKSIQI